MPDAFPKILIVYLSPSGSTAHVARAIQHSVEAIGTPVALLDLGAHPDPEAVVRQLPDTRGNLCLYIGTPVYAAHAVPPIMEFITRLPAAEKCFSVPFVTWGNVSSGIARRESLQKLQYP